MSTGIVIRPATIGTGWTRRCWPIARCRTPEACRRAGERRAPAASTTCRARTTSCRVRGSGSRARDERPTLDADGTLALDQHLRHADLRHDPRASLGTRARGARGCPTASSRGGSRTDSCRSRRIRRSRSVGREPASQPRRSAPRRMTWSLGGCRRTAATDSSASSVATSSLHSVAVLEIADAMVSPPLGTDRGGCLDRGHPVDQRAAADARAGEHRDGAVPGREQAVVEVQAPERIELVARHRWPRRRTGRPRARRPIDRPRPASAATTPPPAPDPTITTSASSVIGSSGAPVSKSQRIRLDRRPLRRERRQFGLVADDRVPWIAGCVRPRVGVGEERHQPCGACRRRSAEMRIGDVDHLRR